MKRHSFLGRLLAALGVWTTGFGLATEVSGSTPSTDISGEGPRTFEIPWGLAVGDTIVATERDGVTFATYKVTNLRWKPRDWEGDGLPSQHVITFEIDR